MLDKNADHHTVDDNIGNTMVPKPSWRTPQVEAFEQEMNKQERELSKTKEGRADQRRRGLK